MCEYLSSTFAGAGSKGENAEAFAEAARRPGVPYALCVLHGLARGNGAAATKVRVAEGPLPDPFPNLSPHPKVSRARGCAGSLCTPRRSPWSISQTRHSLSQLTAFSSILGAPCEP